MPKTINELRIEFEKRNSKSAGYAGERFARIWLDKNEWDYVDIEQGKTTLSQELRAFGGKRPDFLADTKNERIITALDAKYVTTEGGKVFDIQDEELGKYRALKRFMESKSLGCEAEIFFMVFPKEMNGKYFVWVVLEEFDQGTPSIVRSKPATRVSLEDRAELWCQVDA